MRHMESCCSGCGARGGECLHCESEVITCDGCGCEIDGKAYAFPDDSSDEDYCESCFKNRIMDEAETVRETTCPFCESEGVEVFKIEYNLRFVHDEFMFCNDCIDELLTEYEKGGTI